jgi:hypothetical protein
MKCLICGEQFNDFKNIKINGIEYFPKICNLCVNIKAIELGIKAKSNVRAKIRYDIPDDIWDNRLKNRYTTEWWTKKYGEKEGLRKQNEWKQKTSGSKTRYINKYGKKEGTKKYNEFKKNCSIFNEKRIEKYGKEHFLKTLYNYKHRGHTTRIEYYLEQTNGDYEKAALLLSERQRTTILQKYIEKYGEEDGIQKYNETNLKKLNFKKTSKIEQDFFHFLIDKIKEKGMEYIDIKQQRHFFIGGEKHRNVLVDIYIPEKKTVIEFYGDFWHCNPEKYTEDFFNNVLKMTAKEKWKYDSDRLKLLKQKYNVKIIVVWENHFRKNKNKIIKKIIEEIWN